MEPIEEYRIPRQLKGRRLTGRKGGGKGAGADFRAPFEQPNTLKSEGIAKVIDMLGEGVIEGLVDGLKSVYLDDTPVQGPDDSEDNPTYNFTGINIEIKSGTPDQEPVTGFTRQSNEETVATEITIEDGPVTYTLEEDIYDSVRVKILIPQLTLQLTENGDLLDNTVEIMIEVSSYNPVTASQSAFEEVVFADGSTTFTGKCVSEYLRDFYFLLTKDDTHTAPYQIRVTRITEDAETVTVQNRTFFSSITRLIERQLSYPDSALAAITIHAGQFGTRVPSRAYEIYGIRCQIPSNYDPITRVYTGIWDGTFITAWTNNPAWVFYDICTNGRYGLGAFIREIDLNVGLLYSIGQRCDELVSDGQGGEEPRFTFNGSINTRQEAYHTLQAILSNFQAMMYYGTGTLEIIQDAPQDYQALLSPANVIDGSFEYAGTSIRNRHSVARVAWSDPQGSYKTKIEFVEDRETLDRIGYNPIDVIAVGCTSRGQARRYGRWILDTERHSSRVVSYSASMDNSMVRPGEVVAINDPTITGVEWSGRLIAASVDENSVFVDRSLDLSDPKTYYMTIAFPDEDRDTYPNGLRIETRTISSSGAAVTEVEVTEPFSVVPPANLIWAITSTDLDPTLYRILSVRQEADQPNIFTFTGLYHDPGKYERVDNAADIPDPENSLIPTGPFPTPSNLLINEALYVEGGQVRSKAIFSWTPPDDIRITMFHVQYRSADTSDLWISYNTINDGPGITQSVVAEIRNVSLGPIEFRVRGSDNFGRYGQFAYQEGIILGLLLPPDDVEDFTATVQGTNILLRWSPVTSVNLDHYEIRYSSTLVGATWAGAVTINSAVAASAKSLSVPAVSGTYFIKARSTAGVFSKHDSSAVISSIGESELNFVDTIEEDPTFDGTLVDMQVFDDKLKLADSTYLGYDSFEISGSYEFDNQFDLGGIYDVVAIGLLSATGQNKRNVMSSWTPLSSITNMSGYVANEVDIRLQISVTQDDPTGSPVWTDWIDFTSGDFRCWGMKFRILMETSNPFMSGLISALGASIYMRKRVISQGNISSGTGGYAVTFTPNFYSPNPIILITPENMQTGDYYTITDVDETGFVVEFFNSSNVSVDRIFAFSAEGWGSLY